MRADWIDTAEVDIDPRRFSGGAKGFDGMARATVRANDAFVLCLFENIHDGTVARGPITLGETVHEKDGDIFATEFAAEAVEGRAHAVGVARPRFGEEGN